MSAANGAGGQAPTSASQGQAPQANNGGSPSTAPQGQAPEGNTSAPSSAPSASGQQQMSQADYDRIIADLRKENAAHRTENARTAAELKKFQDAQLTTEQKRERDLSEMQTKYLEMELRTQRLTLENAGYKLGSTLGIGDISAALALVQVEHGSEIKYAADGSPENISDLLKAVLKDHPALAAAAAQAQQRQPASSGGPVNPGAVARAGGTFTREQIARMSSREYEQNRAAIMEQLKSGGLRP